MKDYTAMMQIYSNQFSDTYNVLNEYKTTHIHSMQ